MTKRPNWIPVVAGLIKKDNKFLVGQRPEKGHMSGRWEFPGGKIESGESPEEALKRELQEELGFEAQIGSIQLAVTHSYAEVGVVLLLFEVLFWKGEPKAKHHTELRWVSMEELEGLPLPDANKLAINQLKGFII